MVFCMNIILILQCIKIKILILFFEHSKCWQSSWQWIIHGCSNSYQWQWHSSSFFISLAFELWAQITITSTLITAPYSSLCWADTFQYLQIMYTFIIRSVYYTSAHLISALIGLSSYNNSLFFLFLSFHVHIITRHVQQLTVQFIMISRHALTNSSICSFASLHLESLVYTVYYCFIGVLYNFNFVFMFIFFPDIPLKC